jgi:predicted N-formylglutamate amidohydrolase
MVMDGPGNIPRLLDPEDVPPLFEQNAGGRSPFLFTCDHYGRLIPRKLGDLGLPKDELTRHIAWDIGIAGVAETLSNHLDAQLIGQRYSRLVIDCNRPFTAASSIPRLSEATMIPGNEALTQEAVAARRREIFDLYHQRIKKIIDQRQREAKPTILVALHSFTPRMNDFDRPWQAGILHFGHENGFALALLAALRARLDVVGDNEPYKMDGTDYTVPFHAFAARRPYAEVEIRQDLLGAEGGPARWCDLLGDALEETAAVSAVRLETART